MSPSERLFTEVVKSLWVQCYANACDDPERIPAGVVLPTPGPGGDWVDSAPSASEEFSVSMQPVVERFLGAQIGTGTADDLATAFAVAYPHYSKGGDIEAFAWNLGFAMTGSGGGDWALGRPAKIPSCEHLYGYFSEDGEFHVE